MKCVNCLQVSPKTVSLQKGKWYYGMSVQVFPSDADCRCVTWHSENPQVASVNASSGYIYAKSAGTVRIYATATDGSGCRDFVTVTVKDSIPVESVTLNRTSLTLEKGKTAALSVTVCPTNATNRNVNWTSSDNGVATVNNGIITAVYKGSARITATATDGSGKSASCLVSVTGDILVTSIKLTPSNVSLRIGSSIYPSVTICPTNATKKSITWRSANSNIASVNPNSGLVYAKAVGTTTIYATACDGSGIFGCCGVTCNGSGGTSSGTDLIGDFHPLSLLSAAPAGVEMEAPVLRGVQFKDSQNGYYNIRFVSQIKNLYYRSVGYEIHSQYDKAATVSDVLTSKVVYTSLLADGKKVYPDNGFEYFVVGVVENVPQNAEASFKIVPFAITLAGEYVYGSTTSFSSQNAHLIDYVAFEVSENVEYHLLCNGDNNKALRIGTNNVFKLTGALPIRGEKQSYWMRQKWILRNDGGAKKLFTKLNNNYYLCNNGSGDAYISNSASDNNSNIVIIPCANNSEFYEIKLANYDLYLTLDDNPSNGYCWAKWSTKKASNGSNQAWKFVEQPANLHNGVDTGSILNETTIQALKSENTEFVIRYYKILDTLKGVNVKTKGATPNDYTVIDDTIDQIEKKGIDLDVENYLGYADTIPVSDYTLFITGNGKSLLPDEKAKYLNNNLNIVTAYQNDGRKYEYFTEKHAKLDALSAVLSAKALGQPYGTTIYFAVDYDADISQLERIRNYFNIVKNKIGGRYKIGVYGNGLVCSSIKPIYAQYSWLCHSTTDKGYEDYDDISKYNIKQAEMHSCNGIDVDDDVAVGSDYGQW